jgi:hypothetical protein
MLKNKKKDRTKVEKYTPTEILEKGNKLSGDWLEKEVKKRFSDSGDNEAKDVPRKEEN